MGYNTRFRGSVKLSRKLKEEEIAYLNKFMFSRRMARDPLLCENFHDPYREMVGLPIGEEGEFCVFGTGYAGQDHDISVISYNDPPYTQNSLWMSWTIGNDKKSIKWNGSEKFYSYYEWLVYIHNKILSVWGVTYLSSNITYSGEEKMDKGFILVEEVDGKKFLIDKNRYGKKNYENDNDGRKELVNV